MSEHRLVKVSQQAIIQNGDGAVLLLCKVGSGNWFLPGGRIETADTDPIAGFQRELREELGCEVAVIRPFAVDFEEKWNVYAIAFLCTTESTDFVLSEEHSEMKWVAPKEVVEWLYYKRIGKAIKEQLG